MVIPETHLLYKEVEGVKRLCVSYSQIDTFLSCPMKWHKTYIEGKRSTEKQEATSYGTVVHQTLEYFFKNRCRSTGEDLGNAISYFAYKENIPFTSPENMLIAMKQSGELLAWLVQLFSPGDHDGWKIPDSDLNPFEKLLRKGTIIGVEEDFILPYKLPVPIEINGVIHTHVYIIGSLDLHLAIKHKGLVYHYVIDWKSGNKVFDEKKLKTNLQHPVYSFYIYRKYGQGLPRGCVYFFTRTRQYQKVKVDEERKEKSIQDLNSIFSRMYDFSEGKIDKATVYIEEEQSNGEKKYVYKKAKLNPAVQTNQEPCPSALCYYCDFGLHKKNECPYSSDWDPSKKKKR